MSDSPHLQPGDLVAHRYRIEGLLGSGGHAHVYIGRQQGIERQVAIKVLKGSSEIGNNQLSVLQKRFEQEAKLIAQLKDPHTITLYDYGMTQTGQLYMASEFVDGRSLKEVQKSDGQFSPERVLNILKQLLSSLQEAHALGVLHRDIKPDNIMLHSHLGRRDQVKLLDFGIAKLVGSDTADFTTEGSVVGTPRYIPPERVTSANIGPQSDLYSLGMVAYEMLTGERVYAGKKGIEVLRAQISESAIKLPASLRVPYELRQIVDKLNEKDLNLRYSLASEVLQDITNAEQSITNAPDKSTLPTVPKVPPRATHTLDAKPLKGGITPMMIVSHLLSFSLGGLFTALLFLFLIRG